MDYLADELTITLQHKARGLYKIRVGTICRRKAFIALIDVNKNGRILYLCTPTQCEMRKTKQNPTTHTWECRILRQMLY